MCGTRCLFIYYRLPSIETAAVEPVLHAAQKRLMDESPGLLARLFRRADHEKGETTVMETYAMAASAAPAGIDGRLQARIEACMTAALAATGTPREAFRHVEAFDACA